MLRSMGDGFNRKGPRPVPHRLANATLALVEVAAALLLAAGHEPAHAALALAAALVHAASCLPPLPRR